MFGGLSLDLIMGCEGLPKWKIISEISENLDNLTTLVANWCQ